MSTVWRDLPLRAATVTIGVPAAVALVLTAPSWLFALAVSLLAGVASAEYLTLVGRTGNRVAVVTVATAMLLPLAGLLAAGSLSGRLALLIPAVVTVLLALGVLQRQWRAGGSTKRSGTLYSPVFALSYSGLLTSLVVVLREAHGPGWVVLALAIAWGGDIGGYLVGRSIGRGTGRRARLLAPRLSPRKTVAGAVGGLVAATGAALVIRHLALPGESLALVVVLASTGSVAAQLGDLFESGIKRLARASDSGSVILGNGGVLDTMDGLLFVTPWLLAALPLVQ